MFFLLESFILLPWYLSSWYTAFCSLTLTINYANGIQGLVLVTLFFPLHFLFVLLYAIFLHLFLFNLNFFNPLSFTVSVFPFVFPFTFIIHSLSLSPFSSPFSPSLYNSSFTLSLHSFSLNISALFEAFFFPNLFLSVSPPTVFILVHDSPPSSLFILQFFFYSLSLFATHSIYFFVAIIIHHFYFFKIRNLLVRISWIVNSWRQENILSLYIKSIHIYIFLFVSHQNWSFFCFLSYESQFCSCYTVRKLLELYSLPIKIMLLLFYS